METKDKSAIENDAEEEITDSEIGDWAVVQYDKQMYPGEITDAFNKKVVVLPCSQLVIVSSGPTERMNGFTHFQPFL